VVFELTREEIDLIDHAINLYGDLRDEEGRCARLVVVSINCFSASRFSGIHSGRFS
jgi:hypothetical protein